MRNTIFFVLAFCLGAGQSLAANCQERRGTLDFGSGTTKALAAVVDVCEKRIVQVIYEKRLPLALNEALEKSETKEVPDQVIAEALPKIQSVVSQMRELQVEKIEAVATSVFRVARNGSSMAKKISTSLGIPVEVISQTREAELGYWSALGERPRDENQVVVWDIGGGSMQMYTKYQGKTWIYEGNLASVTFKNKILEVLQFKDPKKVSSPNPIGGQREAAIQLAKNHAYLNVPTVFKKIAPTAAWIGVGGVLSMSVQRQSAEGQHEFTQEQLELALKKRVLLRDEEIDSDYRVSDVSNLALVLGYMKALGIKKLETVQASLGQGLLIDSLNK